MPVENFRGDGETLSGVRADGDGGASLLGCVTRHSWTARTVRGCLRVRLGSPPASWSPSWGTGLFAVVAVSPGAVGVLLSEYVRVGSPEVDQNVAVVIGVGGMGLAIARRPGSGRKGLLGDFNEATLAAGRPPAR